MAIEDAAVLGNLFSRISHPSQIAPLLSAYQGLRLPRTANTQASSRLNQKIFHLPDGPDQQERDNAMRRAMVAEFESLERELRGEKVDQGLESEMGNPNQWADRQKNLEQFRYDADQAVEQWWRSVGERELGVSFERIAARL